MMVALMILGAHFICDFTVDSLIDDKSKRWNEVLEWQVFSNDIAYVVLNTPLFDQVQNDLLIWKEEKNGSYSVLKN